MKNRTGILAAVLLLAAVCTFSCKSGGNGNPGGMMMPVTTFIPDIGTSAAQEIVLEAIDVQAREITLAVRTHIGGTLRRPLSAVVEFDMDPTNLDPISVGPGDFSSSSATTYATLVAGPSPNRSRLVVGVTGDCGSGCPDLVVGPFLIGTVRIRIKNSGAHRIELVTPSFGSDSFSHCNEACPTTQTPITPVSPLFGGTVMVP